MDLLLTTITWLLIGGAVLTVIGMVVFGVIFYKSYKDAKIRHNQFEKAMDEKKKEFDEQRSRIERRFKDWR